MKDENNNVEKNRIKKASLTVEASLICPIFIFVTLSLIYIIMWFLGAVSLRTDMTKNARTLSASAAIAVNEKKADEVKDIILFERCNVGYLPVKTNHKVVMRPFVGVSSIDSGKNDPIVYITPNGTVYHTNRTCSYIKVSVNKIHADDIPYKRNNSGEKYKPCEICCKKNDSLKEVYITKYGNRYHYSLACKSLYHDVISIRLSEVKHMRKCSKCSKSL